MFWKSPGVFEGVLKISSVSLENACEGYKLNLKFWLYAFSLHLNFKKTPTRSSFPVISAEFLEELYFRTPLGENF